MSVGACFLISCTAATWVSMIVWLSTPTPTAGRLSASEFFRTVLQNDCPFALPPLLHAPNAITPSTTSAVAITVRTPIRIQTLCRTAWPNGVYGRHARLPAHAHRQGGDRGRTGVAGPHRGGHGGAAGRGARPPRRRRPAGRPRGRRPPRRPPGGRRSPSPPPPQNPRPPPRPPASPPPPAP